MFQDFRLAELSQPAPVERRASVAMPEPLRCACPEAGRAAESLAKRTLDVIGAALLLLALFPLLALVALAIRLESDGPVFFRQRRTGLGGKVFFIYKFRTMSVCEDGGDVRQAVIGDKRITRVGRWLRMTSVDELPQLLNVIGGEMSLVGPRPHAIAHDEQFGRLLPHYEQRFAVRPGITGLAQVSGLRGETRTVCCVANRVAADVDYINGWSIGSDLSILLRSALIVFRGGGH